MMPLKEELKTLFLRQGPERPGMLYNGTCLPPGGGGTGGDCNAMSVVTIAPQFHQFIREFTNF